MERVVRNVRNAHIRGVNNVQYNKPQMPRVTNTAPHVPSFIPRPSHKRLTTVKGKITKLALPHGSFNAGITKLPHSDKYICVYRPTEYAFTACILNKEFLIEKNSSFDLKITNCADPRIIWIGNKLLMVYSSNEEGLIHECIRGGYIMDLDKGAKFMVPELFRVSPLATEVDYKGVVRQKNWMPFVHENSVYLISLIKPHVIFELLPNGKCEKRFETEWIDPWFNTEFFRGNTNPVQLADGNYLATFHTVHTVGSMNYYDNGCYVFEGKPPFKVLKCANRTYLKAEDAVEPHFRKAGIITVNFPVGMIREDERILISYGDNDSCVKILETTVKDMVDTTLDVY